MRDDATLSGKPITDNRTQAVGKALNCSVNDVLLSCVAGAIGQYLVNQGDSIAGQEIRAMIPVKAFFSSASSSALRVATFLRMRVAGLVAVPKSARAMNCAPAPDAVDRYFKERGLRLAPRCAAADA